MLPTMSTLTPLTRPRITLTGKEGAMACTVAVEDTIVTHYTDQIREIIEQGKEEDYTELLQVCRTFYICRYRAVPHKNNP